MEMSQLFQSSVLLISAHLLQGALTQQCRSETSILGWMLQGHIYKTMQADRPHACVFACYKDDRCQSLNWVISVLTCEFNNRTKEARPEDFIPNADRSYFKRENDRGKYNDEGFDICYQLGDSHATINLACSADVFLQFARESAMLKLPKERRLPSELLFLLSPIFHCQKIKDGGYNNITNTNKSFAHTKYACSAGYH